MQYARSVSGMVPDLITSWIGSPRGSLVLAALAGYCCLVLLLSKDRSRWLCVISVLQVGQFRELVEMTENSSDLKHKLRHLLKLSPEKWEEVTQHALSA